MAAGAGGVEMSVNVVGEPMHAVSAVNLASGKALILIDFTIVSCATTCVCYNKSNIIGQCICKSMYRVLR